jgi:hypothetical protein
MSPAQPNSLNVQKVSEETVFDQFGKPQTFIRVDFMVGAHGPFTERMLKAEYTPSALLAKLHQMQASVTQLAQG